MIETSRTISIRVNGDAHSVQSNITLEGLLIHLNRNPNAPGVAVALNDAVMRRAEWRETSLTGGDRVEIIAASQGG